MIYLSCLGIMIYLSMVVALCLLGLGAGYSWIKYSSLAESPNSEGMIGHVSLARRAFARSGLYHLPEGILSIAQSQQCHLPKGIIKCVVCPKGLYHLPLGICITCLIEFNESRG